MDLCVANYMFRFEDRVMFLTSCFGRRCRKSGRKSVLKSSNGFQAGWRLFLIYATLAEPCAPQLQVYLQSVLFLFYKGLFGRDWLGAGQCMYSHIYGHGL